MIHITDHNKQKFESEHMDKVRLLGGECTLLLKKDESLPLAKPCRIALYGSGARNTIKGGTGSGDVNVRHFVTVEEGLEKAGFTIISKKWMEQYEKLRADCYQEFLIQVRKEAKEKGLNPVMYGMGKVMPEPSYEFALDDFADAAVYLLSRNSGEGADRKEEAGDIELSETEIRDIRKLNEMYEKFVLVLNVGGMVNLKPVADAKNILLLSQLGTSTGDILADLLLGKAYPSGKLTMTWAPIEEYSSTEGFGDLDDTYYKEGIYVGYRYFDTIKTPPIYPFGFGLSYTEFSFDETEFKASEKSAEMTVCVTNTGRHCGKEVVQVYSSSPSGKLEKPYQELRAFAKTRELEPGESEKVTISFPIEEMASYDTELASYVLEAGDYLIRMGNSSRNTKVVGVIRFDKTVITKKVRNICPGSGFEDLSISSQREECLEAVNTISVDTDKMKLQIMQYKTEPVEIENHGFCTWQQVLEGEKTIDEFVGSLSEEQLTYLSIGLFHEEGGMESQIGAAAESIAGGAGETTTKLSDLGVPTLSMADGPAGLRLSTKYKIVNGKIKGMDSALESMMDFMEPEMVEAIAAATPKATQEEIDAPINYVYCTAIPIGTALAQSWNKEVAKTCGDIVGKEMEMFGVHLWLAPALNIHRSPLCGRNFEYFSEDPVISGEMAAAITNGVQQHKGCATTIKHFVCNNQETNRVVSNSIVSERALREIYLKGFEICVEKSMPKAIMTSYNLINGEHACNSKDLLTNVLRNEWNYEGFVMTDWYAAETIMIADAGRDNRHSAGVPSGCIQAGNDLIMPGMLYDKTQVMGALNQQDVEYPIVKAELQATAKRVLAAIKSLV